MSSRPRAVRTYGKRTTTRPRIQPLSVELTPKSVEPSISSVDANAVEKLEQQFFSTTLNDAPPFADQSNSPAPKSVAEESSASRASLSEPSASSPGHDSETEDEDSETEDQGLRVISWDDVCPFGDKIEKIAEASYAEVYRVTNARGTSIIKAIRLESPIKPQTKAQQKSGLVDEVPHSEDDLRGELMISEWLADIPGFVVYKERYVVKGKAPKSLLETHRIFQRKLKREDPDRAQFYPSPSRYLDDTRFLVVELGDAGTALEDFELTSASQLWDIFLHTAVALARAEDLVSFEHRDLHEGNLCIHQSGAANTLSESASTSYFGRSGLDITILDYGLSRAEDPDQRLASPVAVAFDLEKDLSLFSSTHAPQCKVYRQMRSYLLKGDRVCLGPESHDMPYQTSVDSSPISWQGFYPYTNVLWLSYIYQYLIDNFKGDRKELARWRRTTRELAAHLNPEAPKRILSFPSASDVVRFSLEVGWITEEQLIDEASKIQLSDMPSFVGNESIIMESGEDSHLRRSPRRHQKRPST